jgi:hypothetical protein
MAILALKPKTVAETIVDLNKKVDAFIEQRQSQTKNGAVDIDVECARIFGYAIWNAHVKYSYEDILEKSVDDVAQPFKQQVQDLTQMVEGLTQREGGLQGAEVVKSTAAAFQFINTFGLKSWHPKVMGVNQRVQLKKDNRITVVVEGAFLYAKEKNKDAAKLTLAKESAVVLPSAAQPNPNGLIFDIVVPESKIDPAKLSESLALKARLEVQYHKNSLSWPCVPFELWLVTEPLSPGKIKVTRDEKKMMESETRPYRSGDFVVARRERQGGISERCAARPTDDTWHFSSMAPKVFMQTWKKEGAAAAEAGEAYVDANQIRVDAITVTLNLPEDTVRVEAHVEAQESRQLEFIAQVEETVERRWEDPYTFETATGLFTVELETYQGQKYQYTATKMDTNPLLKIERIDHTHFRLVPVAPPLK